MKCLNLKIKLRSLICLITLLSANGVFAQTQNNNAAPTITNETKTGILGWNLQLGVSYGVPFLTSRQGSFIPWLGQTFIESNGTNVTQRSEYGTFGGGPSIHLETSKLYKNFIGFGLRFTYSDFPVTTSIEVNSPLYKASQTTDPWVASLSPFFVFTSNSKKRVYLIGKIGLHFPIAGKSKSTIKVIDHQLTLVTDLILMNQPEADIIRGFVDLIVQNNPTIPLQELIELNLDSKAVTSFKATVGLMASLGVLVKISDRLRFTSAINVIGFSLKAKQTTLPNFELNGKILGQPISDIIPEIDLNGSTVTFPINSDNAPSGLTIINYSDELNEQSNSSATNPNSNLLEPTEALSFKNNSTAIYLEFGLQFGLERNKKIKQNDTTNKL